MLEFLNLKPEAFGLDISDLSLKVIKLTKTKGSLSLASFGEMVIKPGIIEQGKIKDEKSLTEIIRAALRQVKGKKIRTKYVVASLPEQESFLQVIQMPKLRKEELSTAVRFEGENYIPLPMEEVYFDFQKVEPVYDHLDHIDVLIAALPKKIVDPYLFCLTRAGLIPQAFEVESLAISRALIKNEVTTYPVLLVDLGATRTGFIIFSGRSLRFTSSILVSSHSLTESIARNLNIDMAEAEKLKRRYGLSKDKSKQAQQVFDALVPALVDLGEQIQKYIDYYRTHTFHEHLPPDGRGVGKVFLCGGGANLLGFPEFLSSRIKIPVELGNPWVNILKGPLKKVPQLSYSESLGYTTALGLALRGLKAN